MPLHVRAGAIIPMGPVKQYVDEPVDGPLTLVVYPGADGAFALYEDDGKSFDYRQGEWMRIAMTWTRRDAARCRCVSRQARGCCRRRRGRSRSASPARRSGAASCSPANPSICASDRLAAGEPRTRTI